MTVKIKAGMTVEARYNNSKRFFRGKVLHVNINSSFAIHFDDGFDDVVQEVKRSDIRLPDSRKDEFEVSEIIFSKPISAMTKKMHGAQKKINRTGDHLRDNRPILGKKYAVLEEPPLDPRSLFVSFSPTRKSFVDHQHHPQSEGQGESIETMRRALIEEALTPFEETAGSSSHRRRTARRKAPNAALVDQDFGDESTLASGLDSVGSNFYSRGGNSPTFQHLVPELALRRRNSVAAAAQIAVMRTCITEERPALRKKSYPARQRGNRLSPLKTCEFGGIREKIGLGSGQAISQPRTKFHLPAIGASSKNVYQGQGQGQGSTKLNREKGKLVFLEAFEDNN